MEDNGVFYRIGKYFTGTFGRRNSDIGKGVSILLALIASLGAMVVVLVLLLASTSAWAVEPGHYGPGDGSGVGITVECQADGPCAAIWYNYLDAVTVVNTTTHQGQIWLYADPPCPRGHGQCAVDWLLTGGSWNGRGGFEFSDPVGSAILDQIDPTTLEVDYEVFRLRPAACDTGVGGLLIKECIGVERYQRIVGED